MHKFAEIKIKIIFIKIGNININTWSLKYVKNKNIC